LEDTLLIDLIICFKEIVKHSTPSAVKQPLSDDESVGQKVQMLLDQAAAANSQTNSEETITLHSAQGQQTVTISPDNLPQTITIQSTNVLLKQPNRQWQEQVHIHLVFKTFVYTTFKTNNQY
jgi:hypothetical protein